ncbi:MAG: hypothetical protein CM15mP62_17370 [Rhodospirillaceae bacterium]|nr:MAG: hypothetical protein CM15mP62_17370 [Rhodospirillaceae bacterium]
MQKLHIAAKLLLEKGQKVLDIGSGWGGLGRFLAELEEISLDGVTLSREQHRYSCTYECTAKQQNVSIFSLKTIES